MEIQFNYIGGATFILNIDQLKIACDPVLCSKGSIQDFFWFKSERLEEPVYDEATFKDIDLWLITHNHEDHLDAIGLSKINSHSKVICNKNASSTLYKSGISDLTILDWYNSSKFTLKGYSIEIKAIPAIHGINPVSALFAGKGNGYCMRISKGNKTISIYMTGDTVFKSKIIQTLKDINIDLIIANMGAAQQGHWIMTLTLNAKMLKKLMDKLRPQIVIPVHHGTFKHYVEPIDCVIALQDDRIKIVKPGENYFIDSM